MITLTPGDCRDVLANMPADSVDSVVTDPPYELAFMGRGWDSTGVAFCADTWRAVLHVLRPGAHLLAFGSTRTQHRMICAIEDAGFQIRDCLLWIHAQGFPKSLNIGNGLGTALKPAVEMICLARKPLAERTVAANVLAHGTGALNVDACRVACEERPLREHTGRNGNIYGAGIEGSRAIGETTLGRWPANVAHDGSPEVEAAFAVAGERASGARSGEYANGTFSSGTVSRDLPADTGSASRFFYAAKADSADRADSRHPTVKPVDLMRWLVRLITPPGGTVLDPFAGSGTTGEAAMLEGMRAVLIEQDPAHVADIRHRMGRWSGQDLPLFTSWPPADDPADARMADLFATRMAAD